MDTAQNQNPFVSRQNLTKLRDVMQDFLQHKHNVDLSSLAQSGIDISKLIFGSISTIVKGGGYADTPLNELNLRVLKMTKEAVVTAMMAAENKASVAARDADLYKDRPRPMRDTVALNSHVQSNGGVDINREFEMLSKARSTQIEENERLKSGSLDTPVLKDDKMNQDDFGQRLDDVLKERKLAAPAPPPATKKPVEEFQATLSEDNTESTYLADTVSLYSAAPQSEPQDFYKVSTDANADIEGQLATYNSTPVKPEDTINTLPTSASIKSHYVVVNSGDRSWSTFPNRYHFQIRFDHTTSSTDRFDVYENNPTVPFLSSRSTPNVNGWTHPKTGVQYPAYDSSAPLGSVVGQETVTVGANESAAYTDQTFKNVTGIQFTRVIIPIDMAMNSAVLGPEAVTRENMFNFNFPYILLKVDEFSNLVGTNNTIRNSFCQLEHDGNFYAPNGRGYMRLRPIQNERHVFNPTMIASLASMTVSLLKPNGELLSDARDGNEIIKVSHDEGNSYFIGITFKHFFEKNQFYVGDYITIKKYVLYNISDEQDASHIDSFMAFMNRESGHEIVSVAEANEYGMFNQVFIRAPMTVDTVKGTKCVDEDLVKQVRLYNCAVDELDTSSTIGEVLNTSLQLSFSMTLGTSEYNVSTPLQSVNV